MNSPDNTGENYDALIIGSGVGGATLALRLVKSGLKVLMLERGDFLPARPENRDPESIFAKGIFRPNEHWHDRDGRPFSPGNYYYVGGNSKFYGSAMCRFRAEDFGEINFKAGLSPAWPYSYETLAPYYTQAEEIYKVCGDHAQDLTEPAHESSYPFKPVPDEPSIAAVRGRLRASGYNVSSIPLAMQIEQWLADGQTPWDAFPNDGDGKLDAETAAIKLILDDERFKLLTNTSVMRLETSSDGTRVEAAIAKSPTGVESRYQAKNIFVCAGAINSALILLDSKSEKHPDGLANSSGQVGRNFMNHNSSAMLAISPTFRNNAIYQKTIQLTDFYFGDEKEGRGIIQLLGKIDGTILKANMGAIPHMLCDWIAKHSVDWYLMSEDLPFSENRVFRTDDGKVHLHWTPNNLEPHRALVRQAKKIMRSIGFPFTPSREFDKRTPSHQCGTVRMGKDPSTAVLDENCRTYDIHNLYVVDASFLPSSAALNPALTIAAQALKTADAVLPESHS